MDLLGLDDAGRSILHQMHLLPDGAEPQHRRPHRQQEDEDDQTEREREAFPKIELVQHGISGMVTDLRVCVFSQA